MMKEYGWRVPEAQRASLIMVEENMTALENGVQVKGDLRGVVVPGRVWVGEYLVRGVEERVSCPTVQAASMPRIVSVA